MRFASLFLILAAVAPAATGQIMTSTNYQVTGFSLDDSAGGSSSSAFTVYSQVGALCDGPTSSTNFSAQIGFLETFDPDPGTAPVIYGVLPPHGHKDGGEPVTVYGRNLGTGFMPDITLGGATIAPVFASATVATGVAPVGAAGLAEVVVSHGDGTDSEAGGFVFSPALVTSEFAYLGSRWPLAGYGELGHSFQTWLSLTLYPGPVNTNFGPLYIGPGLLNIIPGLPYFGPGGITSVGIPVPTDPIISGIVFYMQNVNIIPGNPPGQLTNLTQVTFI